MPTQGVCMYNSLRNGYLKLVNVEYLHSSVKISLICTRGGLMNLTSAFVNVG